MDAQGAADVDARVTLDSSQNVAGSASANPRWSELAWTPGFQSRGICHLARPYSRCVGKGSDREFSLGCLVRRLCRWHILQLARSLSGRFCTNLCYLGALNIVIVRH